MADLKIQCRLYIYHLVFMLVEDKSNSDQKLDALLERALRSWDARGVLEEELATEDTDWMLDKRSQPKQGQHNF